MGELLIVWSARIVVLFYALRLAADFLVVDPDSAGTLGSLGLDGRLCPVSGPSRAGLPFPAPLESCLRRRPHGPADQRGGRAQLGRRRVHQLRVYRLVGGRCRVVVDSAARHEPTPAAAYWIVHAIFAFMFFNATVVFGPPFWKWIALAAACVLIAARLFLARNRQFQPVPEKSAGAG